MADDTSTETPDATETDAAKPEPSGSDQQKQDIPPAVARALREANKEAEKLRLRLKEYEDRDKTEQQKLEERAAEAEKAAANALRELTRVRVAAQQGLTPDLAARLQGDTEEELTADAEKLKQLLGTPAPPSFDSGPRTSAPAGADMNALIRSAAGRQH